MPISFQLYSARNFTPWSDVYALLAGLGISQVEGFGDVYVDAAHTRSLLDQNGLTMPSGHFSIDALENDLDGVISTANTLGIRRIFCPYLDASDRPTDSAGWISFAKRLEAVGGRVRDAGFGFGWHNHDFEFVACPDGQIPMSIILQHAPNIDWEADIAWIVRGGADAAEWIGHHGSRITAAHVKDIAPEGENAGEDGWADLGKGTVDWSTIYSQLKEVGVELFVLEHDNPSDLTRYASVSVATFKAL